MKSALLVIGIGISIWLAALIVALAIGAQSKVIYTCLVGIALGLIGIRYTIRRANRGEI